MPPKLLLATNNPGKVRELRKLLADVPFELVTPAELGIELDVAESGETLEENARLKAMAFARAGGVLALADDSGLEVDALGGEPGVRSARYAGDNATDSRRVEYLLARLQSVPWAKRTAHFRCVIAIANPNEVLGLCPGELRGFITFEPRGGQGFGYDPVFYLPQFDKTLAELPPEVKNQVSHRAAAARRAREFLASLAGEFTS